MKVLLLGEYSGVHSNLREALIKKGFTVMCIHNGDGYKGFKPDEYIRYNYISSENIFLNFILKIYYIFLSYTGLKGIFQILKYLKIIKKMKNYDVVQLINTHFISEYGAIVNLLTFIYLKKNNNKIFLCALGDDYYYIKYCLSGGFKYSVFDRMTCKNIGKYIYSLHYIFGLFNPFLNKYLVRNVNAIIPGLYDYYEPYKKFNNCSEIVPIIIQDKRIDSIVFDNYPVRFFHGWQFGKELRKGNDIFDRALRKLKDNYPEKVDYQVVGGVSYDEYILTYKSSHVFIDQCFSQDCGVNALLGLSEGKVVFSGFEEGVRELYKIKYTPLINALPDEDLIYSSLEEILLNPSLINVYSYNALKFINQFHKEDYVLGKYQKIWYFY